ncbi:hypothetical protein E2C01_013458 [Portunus trituberculatus]|uniref:Uncharacterized protein n=1 Tax=Portunus trituberculatus TaxID=210409 RepID=A0A5B7DGB2_PORTR|nr:hypothetical protein [Portunus trituberculatus]
MIFVPAILSKGYEETANKLKKDRLSSSCFSSFASSIKGILFGVPPISKPTRYETFVPSEEAQPTLGPWTGFEPVRLETPRIPKTRMVPQNISVVLCPVYIGSVLGSTPLSVLCDTRQKKNKISKR